MSISIRMLDDAQSGGTTNSFAYNYFTSFVTGGIPQAGDALVVLVCTSNGGNEVTSITDGSGNTYKQLPGAFVQSNSNGGTGNGYIMDVWYAENIAAGSGSWLSVTVNISGPAAYVAASILDVLGINGGAKTATSSVESSAASPLIGPSLNGGSAALYLTAYEGFYTGSGNCSVGSPWSLGSGNVDVPLDGFNNTSWAVAFLIGSGSQQASWTQGGAGNPAGLMGATFGATPSVAVTTSSLPTGSQVEGYSASLAASGGTAPYTWAIASGSLPPGLNLSSSGVISGTPTAAGTFTFTVRATDANSNTATKSLSIVVAILIGGGFWVQRNQGRVSTQKSPLKPWSVPPRRRG